MPERERWWDWNAGRYAAEQRLKRGWSETSVSNAVRCLRAWPARFAAGGLTEPVFAADVTAEMVLRWKQAPMGPGHYSLLRGPLKQTTAFQALWCLRGFLRWAKNPISEEEPLWRSLRGDATNRRWFDQPTVNRLWAACMSDRERLVLALTAWAGLRRIEIDRLRVEDVSLPMDDPRIVVSRKGGRRQELPVGNGVANALRPFVLGRPSTERVFPESYNVIDRDLRRVGSRIGIPRISCHDLRRTFGRMLYGRGVDINQIRVLFGHRDAAMTYYYIGAESDNLRDAVRQLDPPAKAVSAPVRVGT